MSNFKFSRHKELEAALDSLQFKFIQDPSVRIKKSTHIAPKSCIDAPNMSALELFNQLFGDEIIKHLLAHTNSNISAKNEPKLMKEEIYKYFGHLLMLSVLHLPNYDLLFTNEPIKICYPGRENGLSLHRWKFIHQNISGSALKLKTYLVNSFMAARGPGTVLVIDESRIPARTKKEQHLLLYNPSKPEKWAIEMFTMCDSGNYWHNFTLPNNCKAFTAAKSFVKSVEHIDIQHHFVMDKHFLTFAQYNELINSKKHYFTACVGARNAPANLFKSGLAQGLPMFRSRFARKGQSVAASYKRKGQLNFLSNGFRLEQRGDRTAKARAPLLTFYDTNKRAVDRFNQLMQYHHFRNRHHSVNQSLLISFFEMALTNAFILYKESRDEPLSHFNFLLSIASGLLAKTIHDGH